MLRGLFSQQSAVSGWQSAIGTTEFTIDH